MKTIAIPTHGRAKRAYPASESAMVAAKAVTSDPSAVLAHLREQRRPCLLESIKEHMGPQMDQRRLVAALETLVEQGLVRCKKYANKLIVMYNSLADAAVAPAAPPRKKQPARTTAETEAKQLRATIRKHMDRLRHLQAQREKLEELAVLQECQKETLEEWHVLLKAQGDLRTLALACGGECETLLESHTKKRTALEKLQRLYGHMVAAVCEIEGVQPRALCERLKIEVISLPVKRS